MKVTKENSRELREKMAAEAKAHVAANRREEIYDRMMISWGQWQPDYEGWLKWSDDLYAADAVISAIGDNDQKFRDYQASMREQRERCSMEMGPIMQATVDDNGVMALIYYMYLTPKGVEGAPTFAMLVTEFNKFEEVDGRLMVTRLDLYTDGGNLPK